MKPAETFEERLAEKRRLKQKIEESQRAEKAERLLREASKDDPRRATSLSELIPEPPGDSIL